MPDIAKLMLDAGFDEWSTGGGCMAWGRKLSGHRHGEGSYLLVCDSDNGLDGSEDGIWLGGLYVDEAVKIDWLDTSTSVDGEFAEWEGSLPSVLSVARECEQRLLGEARHG